MPLFESFELDIGQATDAIRATFGPAANLGELLKSSQNRTYKGLPRSAAGFLHRGGKSHRNNCYLSRHALLSGTGGADSP